MKTVEEILALWEDRKKSQHPAIQEMMRIREVADGEVVIPLPELDKAEKPAVANLISEGIEQTAFRVSSTTPDLTYPAINPRIKRQVERADQRRLANLSWWQQNDIRTKLFRKALYLIGYASAPTFIKPDFKKEIPQWEIRSPMAAFPAPSSDIDSIEPDDCIFSYQKTRAWLERNYRTLGKLDGLSMGDVHGKAIDMEAMFDIVEYTDDVEHVLIVVGKASSPHIYGQVPGRGYAELERIPNRAEMPLVVSPRRVTLSKLQGQFNQTIGIYTGMAQLMALDLIAVQKAVFPDLVIIGQNGRPPHLQGGEWKDGLTGEINTLTDGAVEAVQLQPGYKTGESIDRMERAIRLHGVAPQFGGESTTNIRTGRQSEINMSAQIDFRIQKYQEQLARAAVKENERAIAVMKAYFGNKKKSFYVSGFKSTKKTVDYVANDIFDTSVNMVTYSMPGADVNGVILGLGQRVGMGIMSPETAAMIDPLIDDPEIELDRVMSSRLEQMLLEALGQQIAAGALAAVDVANIIKKVHNDNKDLADAIQEAQREAQERQAELTTPESPEAQPGLSPPGAGAEAGGGVVPEVSSDQQNIAQLLRSLRQPSGPAGGRAPAMAVGAGA